MVSASRGVLCPYGRPGPIGAAPFPLVLWLFPLGRCLPPLPVVHRWQLRGFLGHPARLLGYHGITYLLGGRQVSRSCLSG